ncbi:hypothetical protein SH2C18_15210 [Clostridium sediminicola]|uniref:RHS repeat-associated core domain-containing protein n=1 Tax=Clostridium sediminicola TaxID=3114879 RepID=UPI0031F21352
MNLNGTEYYYIRNAQGDITGLFDESGIQVVKYNYDSWGKLTPSQDELDDATDTDKDGITGSLRDSIGVKNPYRYRGYRYDSETNLYYLQSRYYNPEFCRMLNADAIGGKIGTMLSHNAFAYVMNNPVNMEDANGYWPKWTKGLAIAAVTVVAVAAVVIAAPVAACAIGTGIDMATGASASTAMALTSVATVGAYAVAAGVGVFGANRAYEAVSDNNVLRDTVFRGNESAYNTAENFVNIAGAMVVTTAALAPNGTCFVAGTLVAT